MIEKVAPADVSVLILGESGTGKELLARAVHAQSDAQGGALRGDQLRGDSRAAARERAVRLREGRVHRRRQADAGKIEMADGGTLFLDEIGDMPLPLQAKLLRFLQDRVIERVGGRQEIPVDVRIVCATNQDLQALIAEQRFREDLYYRISEVTINVPPLRERRGGADRARARIPAQDSRRAGPAEARLHRRSDRRARGLFVAGQRARAREQGEDAR